MACWIKKHLTTIALVAMLVIGVGLLAYPSVSNWWNTWHMSQAVNLYKSAVEGMSQEEKTAWLTQAQDYNKRLFESGTLPGQNLEGHDEILDVNGNGIIGFVTIAKINVELPIYHDTDETHLTTGVGLVPGTSFPVGGSSTHSALAGHRGLSSALLLTDLDKMEEGDIFSVTVLDEPHYYEVDQILIVEPDKTEALRIEMNEDYCTLVTCTPYAVNSHRLLVRGHRVEDDGSSSGVVRSDAYQIDTMVTSALIACPIVILLIVWVLISTRRRDEKNKDARGDEYK